MNRGIATLAAGCVFAAGCGAAPAADDTLGDKLPEPALRFAKDATARVMETEREWLRLAEGLAKARADFAATDGPGRPLGEQASHLRDGARLLLESRTRLGSDLGRFKDALAKAASHYREVAALYTAQAGQARAGEVRDDYLQLARVYEAKARAAGERSKALSVPAGADGKAEVIEEGNLFLERLIEATSVGPVADADRGLLAGRLKRHAERCQALADELARAVEGFLEAAEAPEVRARVVAKRKEDGRPRQATRSTASDGPAKAAPTRDLSALAGTWTAAVTVRGVRCVQVLRLSADGGCVQTLYRQGAQGRGPLVGTVRATCEWDTDGVLDVYQAGWMIERGQVTLRGKDEWTYEVLTNAGDRDLAGTTLTFIRDGRR